MSGSLFEIDPGSEYLVRAKVAVGSDRQDGAWNAGTHIRMFIEGARAGSGTTMWVPIYLILPWPTIEAFGFGLKQVA